MTVQMDKKENYDEEKGEGEGERERKRGPHASEKSLRPREVDEVGRRDASSQNTYNNGGVWCPLVCGSWGNAWRKLRIANPRPS